MTFTDAHPDPILTLALADLRSSLDGDVYVPGDEGWDDARRPWQLLVDQHPLAVVLAESDADVAATVRVARASGVAVVPQSTGHAAGTVAGLGDAILLRTSRMRGVTIDPARKIAHVQAGAEWSDVAAPAAEHGLAAIAGMSPDVGVVGFTLGGGLGWLGRSHGLAANSIAAVEAVDARGNRIRIDESTHGDLFWALRGGSAPVIVTAIELRLYPLPEIVAGAMLWPLENAADVAHAWRDWAAETPASVTSLARVLRYPPLPDLPPFLRGRAFVGVEVAIQAPAEEAERMLAPLRALSPEFDFVRPMSPAELGTIHGDPQQPVPAHGGSVILAELSTEAVSRFLDCALDDAAAPLLSIEIRHLGGELSPERGEGGAVASLDGEAIVFAVGIVPFPEALGPVTNAADAVADALAPFASPRAFRNFVERPGDPDALYGPALERLRRVTETWDPTGVIRLGHAVR